MSLLDRLFGRSEAVAGPVRATIPSAPVLYRFRALTDFFSDDVGSQYCAGSLYSVRKGNEKLDGLVTRWVAEGKVTRI